MYNPNRPNISPENAELIDALQTDIREVEDNPVNTLSLMWRAADALETDEKRIAKLEDDLRNGTISNPERFKIYGYTVKNLLLFANMCKRNDVREADLKQAAWNLELAVRAYALEREEIIKNTMDEIMMRFTPDFEKAFAEMRGERDEQADSNPASKLVVPKFKQITADSLADMCKGVVLDEDGHAATDVIEWEDKR